MGQAILDQLEGLPREKANSLKINTGLNTNMSNGNASKGSYDGGNTKELIAHPEHEKAFHHARNLSSESIGSDERSLKGSTSSNSGPNTLGNGSLNHPRGPSLITMQRRLVTAKTDFEDLISRLNQEVAVKDYLTTKGDKAGNDSSKDFTTQGKNMLPELDAYKQQLVKLQTQHRELEAKSKADIKLLVKEVKSVGRVQATAQVQECTIINLVDEDKLVMGSTSSAVAFDLVASDNHISDLLSQVFLCPFSAVLPQLLTEEVEDAASTTEKSKFSDDGGKTVDQESREGAAHIYNLPQTWHCFNSAISHFKL
ncbi:hypothetical protein POM88_013669 [Heracleum sosnowskyi]|uniref:Uncharacterized protein n=1 Tax=Heracleum sosnowskyi TaxID=360622 RepID=A0AAD8J0B4_9APIA|nr:hypothetical protein POM88_013669 [Heracleum sosnowskyi]